MNRVARTSAVAVLNAVVLVAALVASATLSPGGADTTLALALTGTAEVDGDDGTRTLAAGDHRLAAGEEIRMTSGGAVLALAEGATLELRAASGAGPGSRLVAGSVPVLRQGDALLVVDGGEQVVEVGGARLRLAGGAARLSRSIGATFAVYAGRAELWSAGRVLEGGLPPLRQVMVPDAGSVPLAPSPLRVAQPPDPGTAASSARPSTSTPCSSGGRPASRPPWRAT